MRPLTITLDHTASFQGSTVVKLLLNEEGSQGGECEMEIKCDLPALMAMGVTPTKQNLEPVRKTVPAVDVERLRNLFAGLEIPVISEGQAGLDGATYALSFDCGMSTASYSWWVEAPPGWGRLAEIAGIMNDLSERV